MSSLRTEAGEEKTVVQRKLAAAVAALVCHQETEAPRPGSGVDGSAELAAVMGALLAWRRRSSRG